MKTLTLAASMSLMFAVSTAQAHPEENTCETPESVALKIWNW